MFVGATAHVCRRLKDKGVGKDAEWGSLLEKAPLRHADDLDSASLSHAVDIFVERHHLLWKVRLDLGPCCAATALPLQYCYSAATILLLNHLCCYGIAIATAHRL